MEEQIENNVQINDPNDKIYIVKAKFKADKLDLYGQIIIFLANNSEPQSYSAIISTHSEVYDIALHTNWDKFEEAIAEQKWKGSFDTRLTNSLTVSLDEMKSNPRLYRGFYENVQRYNYSQVDGQLWVMIDRVLHDRDILLESVIQEITAEEYLSVKDARSKTKLQEKANKNEAADEQPPEPDSFDNDTIVLAAKAVLSPVKGKPIYNLKIGDKIMVKILDISPKQNAYIKLMGLIDDTNGSVKPIPVDVVDLKFGMGKNDAFEILAKIEDGMFVHIMETEKQVKLRMYDPSTDGPIVKTLPKENFEAKVYGKEKSDNAVKAFIIILAVFLLGMTMTFLYLLFLWEN